MGTDGGLWVGKWACDLDKSAINFPGIIDKVYEGELDGASPYYDAPVSEQFIGRQINQSWSMKDLDKMLEAIKEAEEKLTPIIGDGINIIGVQNVW